VKVVYSPRYEIALPGHIWPTSKYRLLAERVLPGSPGSPDRRPEPPGPRPGPAIALVEPRPASWDDLALVHTREYLAKLRTNTLTPDDIAVLELPWVPALADGFRLMVGGTIAAAAAAVEDGLAAHLGGGLHHAFAGHGEGFCPLNDVAVAIRVLQQPASDPSARAHGAARSNSGAAATAAIARAAVVDLDVHHGNGTAMIFERDDSVFTFSMHQQHNYPVFKPRSDLDIGLEDGTRDAAYLDRLAGALPRVLASRPDLIVYLAGADPFEHDRLGGLKLTKNGLAERDRLVIGAARGAGVPIVTVLAGGYAADVRDTVDIHVATIESMASAA
jgi:acetoin utilization deacetylase AcuC-like enzyme